MTRVATDAPIAIAHRGAPRVARENTLESFAAAAALGADWAELDVHVTLDGELVVNHDPDLNRLWGHPGSIARMTLAEVRAASDGLVPLLDDVLREAAASSLRLVIDVSSSQIAEVAARHVAEAGAPALAPAFTGDPAGLVRIRSVLPEAVLLFSWELQELPASGSAGAEALAAAAPQYFNQDCLLLTAQMVQDLHRRGYRVSTYTVDDPEEIRRVLELGVDAVISNDIRLLREVIADIYGKGRS